MYPQLLMPWGVCAPHRGQDPCVHPLCAHRADWTVEPSPWVCAPTTPHTTRGPACATFPCTGPPVNSLMPTWTQTPPHMVATSTRVGCRTHPRAQPRVHGYCALGGDCALLEPYNPQPQAPSLGFVCATLDGKDPSVNFGLAPTQPHVGRTAGVTPQPRHRAAQP